MRSLTALVALGLTLSATPAGAVTDHLQCYKIVDATLHSLKGVVDVNVPSIGLAPGCKLTRAKLYCTAAEKTLVGGTLFNGTLPLTPLPYVGPASGTDRVCYGVRCPSPVRGGPDRTITDQFGTRALTRLRTSMLCTPAGTGAGYCGNGSLDPGEACDGTDLGGATCVGLGFASGVLTCSASCVFDTVACEPTSGLDPTFGAGAAGFVGHGNAAGGDGNDSGNALSIDAAGRLVVAGHSLGSNGQLNLAVWRYAPSGALDTGFNGVGYASHAGAGGETIGTDVVIDASSRIVVAGYSIDTLGNWGMGIWRYNPDGTVDASFNGTGFVRDTSLQSGGVGVALDTSGRIVVAGFGYNGFDWDTMVWRYDVGGTPDTSFNGVGFATHHAAAGGNGEDIAIGIGIDAAGRIVLAGYSTNAAGNEDVTVWRYQTDGTLDPTFNTSGFATHDGAAGGVGDDVGRTVVFDGSDRVLVAGWSPNANGDDDLAVWRFGATGSLDTSFNGTGFVTHGGAAGGNGTDEGRALVIDSSGRIVVTGQSANAAGNPDLAVWRYNANGTLNAGLGGSSGIVTIGGSAGGTNGSDGGRGLRIDATGRLVIAGRSANPAGNLDMTIWRIAP